MKQWKRIALLCMVAVLCLGVACASAQYQKPFILNAFDDTPLNLSPYRGKALLLHFFTEGSEQCGAEMTKIKTLYDIYHQDDLEIILVHVWDGEDETHTQSVLDTHDLHGITVFEDTTGAAAKAISVPGYPFSFFIDKQGYMEDALFYGFSCEVMQEIVDWMDVRKAGDAPQETPAMQEAEVTPAPTPLATEEPADMDAPGGLDEDEDDVAPTVVPQGGQPTKSSGIVVHKPEAVTPTPAAGGAPHGSAGVVDME